MIYKLAKYHSNDKTLEPLHIYIYIYTNIAADNESHLSRVYCLHIYKVIFDVISVDGS